MLKKAITEDKLLKLFAEATLPTKWGTFRTLAFSEKEDDPMPHLTLVSGDLEPGRPVLTRVHSECITGDLFGSQRCDCGEQLHESFDRISKNGGVLLYLRQEGRGIGIINKLKAYNLQDLGLNTIDANLHLGLEADARQYDMAIQMLEYLGIDKINLLTNNPEKINAFANSPITVVRREPLVIRPRKENIEYLKTKREDMGHLFDL